jgi:hypothetical protein
MKEPSGMRNKIIVFMVLLFVFCPTLFAVQKENRVVIKGLRQVSMGGAFIAISDDENAFFYNPAGITQRNDYLLQILSIDAAVTKTTISAIDNIRHLYRLCRPATPSDALSDKYKKVKDIDESRQTHEKIR